MTATMIFDTLTFPLIILAGNKKAMIPIPKARKMNSSEGPDKNN